MLSAAAGATELYSWHAFDAVVVSGGKLQVTLHSRIRTRDHFTQIQQVRGGPVVRLGLKPGFALLGGYYYQPGQNAVREWGHGHRVFGGFEVATKLRAVVISTRVIAERHQFSHSPGYGRYRTPTRFLWERRGVAPFYQVELLAVKQGFHSFRNMGGVRWQVSPRVTAELSYCYDIRRTVWGGDRQAIVTSLRFHKAE